MFLHVSNETSRTYVRVNHKCITLLNIFFLESNFEYENINKNNIFRGPFLTWCSALHLRRFRCIVVPTILNLIKIDITRRYNYYN